MSYVIKKHYKGKHIKQLENQNIELKKEQTKNKDIENINNNKIKLLYDKIHDRINSNNSGSNNKTDNIKRQENNENIDISDDE